MRHCASEARLARPWLWPWRGRRRHTRPQEELAQVGQKAQSTLTSTICSMQQEQRSLPMPPAAGPRLTSCLSSAPPAASAAHQVEAGRGPAAWSISRAFLPDLAAASARACPDSPPARLAVVLMGGSGRNYQPSSGKAVAERTVPCTEAAEASARRRRWRRATDHDPPRGGVWGAALSW